MALPAQEHRYYMKLQPGEPLPADLPPEAQRLRRVEDDVAGGRTPIAAGVVIAMVAAAVGLAAVGAWGGFVAVPFVLAFVAMEWARREPEHAAPPRFVPDDDGEWVIAPRSVVARSLGALAAPPKLSTWVRTLCGVLGMAFVAVIALMAKGGFAAEDAEGIASLLMAGALGAGSRTSRSGASCRSPAALSCPRRRGSIPSRTPRRRCRTTRRSAAHDLTASPVPHGRWTKDEQALSRDRRGEAGGVGAWRAAAAGRARERGALRHRGDARPRSQDEVVDRRTGCGRCRGGRGDDRVPHVPGDSLVFVSLIALYHGLVPGTETVVTPSPRGGYLAFEADPDEARREEPFRIEIVLFFGIIFLMARLIEHFADRGNWAGIALTSIVGIALLHFAPGRDEWDTSELVASLRFRALADPTRPLTDLQRVGRDPIAAEAPVRRPEP